MGVNPLTVLPPKVRRPTYAALALAAIALAAYKATEGDWIEFAIAVLGSLGFGQATANTPDSIDRLRIRDLDAE